jgi:hypothetical protein
MLIFRSEDQRSEDQRVEEHIDRWCSAWKLPRGATLSVQQAWMLADAWYRDRMSPEWRRRTAEEAHELFRSLGLTSDFWRFS